MHPSTILNRLELSAGSGLNGCGLSGFRRELVGGNKPLPSFLHQKEHVPDLQGLLFYAHGPCDREDLRDNGTFPAGIKLHLVIVFLPFVDDRRFCKAPPPDNTGIPPFKPQGCCRYDGDCVRVDTLPYGSSCHPTVPHRFIFLTMGSISRIRTVSCIIISAP